MGLDKSQAVKLANNLVNTAQTFLPDDELLQGGIDAIQKLVAKAMDDTPNGPQFKAALQTVVDAVNDWEEAEE